MRKLIKKDYIKEFVLLFKNVGMLDKFNLVISYEVLSPDSFILCFGADSKYYVIYAEDFVEDIEKIQQVIESKYNTKVVKFFESKNPPNTPNNFYTIKPENWGSLSKYTSSEGLDYVFLAEINTPNINKYYNGVDYYAT